MKLSPKELLEPDPTIEFRQDLHRYFDLQQQHWVGSSVSDICKDNSFFTQVLLRDDQDEKKKQILESINRGVTVHSAIEHWFKTGGEVLDAGDYRAWVHQFISSPNIKGWSCLASEYKMIDRRYDIAGTLDLLLEKDDRIVIADLKTKNVKFSKNHLAVKTQLGGYISLLYHVLPSIDIAAARVYWITPEECSSDEYDTQTCLELYERARSLYRQQKTTF